MEYYRGLNTFEVPCTIVIQGIWKRILVIIPINRNITPTSISFCMFFSMRFSIVGDNIGNCLGPYITVMDPYRSP